MFIIFWHLLVVGKIFLSPQVKRSLIITNKLVYTSCLTNFGTTQDLGSEEVRKYQENLKTSVGFLPSALFLSKLKFCHY